jgi:hypothetical protein
MMPLVLQWRYSAMLLLLLCLQQQRLCNKVAYRPGHKTCAVNPGPCQLGVYMVF